MKKALYYLAIPALAIIIGAITMKGCKKEETTTVSNSPGNNTIIPVSPIVTTGGSWHISYFYINGKDHTADYNGYAFAFYHNGEMTATITDVITGGMWSYDNHNIFHIRLDNTPPLTSLSKGWLVVSGTGSEFDLQDQVTENNQVLHFTKDASPGGGIPTGM